MAPAAIFDSDDGGATWELNRALREHPTRGEWFMGMGTGSENILGSSPGCDDIQIDPADDAHLAAMLQDAGIFVSQDGGASWEARNRGLRSEFLDREGGEAGYDAHSVQIHPLDTARMYAQHHSGVYASRDGGRQ